MDRAGSTASSSPQLRKKKLWPASGTFCSASQAEHRRCGIPLQVFPLARQGSRSPHGGRSSKVCLLRPGGFTGGLDPGQRGNSPAWPILSQNKRLEPSAGGPEKSCCLSFGRDLVRSFPNIFKLPRAKSCDPVAAATGKTLELSRAAGKFPNALDGDLSAGSGDPALKSAEVAVAVRMLVGFGRRTELGAEGVVIRQH